MTTCRDQDADDWEEDEADLGDDQDSDEGHSADNNTACIWLQQAPYFFFESPRFSFRKTASCAFPSVFGKSPDLI